MKRLLILSCFLLLISCNSSLEPSLELSIEPSIESSMNSSYISSEQEEQSSIFESSVTSEKSEICFNITYNEVPENVNGSYASEGEYTYSEVTLFYSNIMGNTGKYQTPTIQMKKEVGYIYNVTPLYGDLTLVLMKNFYHDYTSNVDVDTTCVPTIYVGNEINPNENIIEGVVFEEDTETITYVFEEVESYTHFKIANESNYAQYIVSIEWKC